jgi:hypothetical protein
MNDTKKQVLWLCNQNLFMANDNKKSFTKGNKYAQVEDGDGLKEDVAVLNDQGDDHYFGEWAGHFSIYTD